MSSIRSSQTAPVMDDRDFQRPHPAVQFHEQHVEGIGKLRTSSVPRAARGQARGQEERRQQQAGKNMTSTGGSRQEKTWPTAGKKNVQGRLAAIRPQGSSFRKGRSQDMAKDVTRI